MGIGNKLSEMIAQAYVDCGCRFFVKTSNPRIGVHRDNSPLWKATIYNHKSREDYKKLLDDDKDTFLLNQDMLKKHMNRICYCHEYIGDGTIHEYKKIRTDGQLSIFDFI